MKIWKKICIQVFLIRNLINLQYLNSYLKYVIREGFLLNVSNDGTAILRLNTLNSLIFEKVAQDLGHESV